jgi:hypothetical protein
MRAKIDRKLFIIPLLLLLSIPTSAMAQTSTPGFSTYSNRHFSIKYPSTWNVSDPFANSLSSSGTVFQDPNDTAKVIVGWASPAPSWWLNKNAWLTNLTKFGATVTMISNDTNYLSNSPALTIIGVHGSYKQLSVMTVINGTAYSFDYLTAISNYPTDLDLVNVMLETFHVKGG